VEERGKKAVLEEENRYISTCKEFWNNYCQLKASCLGPNDQASLYLHLAQSPDAGFRREINTSSEVVLSSCSHSQLHKYFGGPIVK
jgi:hypothetical protein